MKIDIREATQADVDAVSAIERICFPAAEAAARDSLEARIRTFPESFFVAEREGELVGMINGGVTDSHTIYDALFENASLHNPNGAWQAVYGLDVIPSCRRQGVAGLLLQRLIRRAREQGRKGVILTCKEELIHYYKTFGFQSLGVSASVHGGAVWYDMILPFPSDPDVTEPSLAK